jgi:hypothetical protein
MLSALLKTVWQKLLAGAVAIQAIFNTLLNFTRLI